MTKISGSRYYDALLIGVRTVGLTMDEARGDLERALVGIRHINLS